MPATVALFVVLKPGWSTLPLAVWFLLALAYEVARLFKAPPSGRSNGVTACIPVVRWWKVF